ncbi:MAG TPA: tellurite resistance TerB C-terminal domain-containing protein, partial [Candidatus Elarobacter sp.]|nr:tellurite resistance TerB C-terminal domain-containing protein [Candidatus Elarobacter sp.]
KRKQVVLGKAPPIAETSPAVLWYRSAVRYAENILRTERRFPAKLRGVDIDASLGKALDMHFADYIRATKPKVRVTIDVTRAESLARESADVRARLLDGVDDESDAAPSGGQVSGATPTVPRNATSHATGSSAGDSRDTDIAEAPAPAEHLATGLLTDLAAVRKALVGLTPPARALIAALVACDWEAPETSSEVTAAASGALVRPLVDAINESAVDTLGDVLIVSEGDTLVVQEDFRDEVYWVLKGTLDGFSAMIASSTASTTEQSVATPPQSNVPNQPMLDSDGFGPGDLRALEMIARGTGVETALSDLAATEATTPLLLLDRLNECALRSSFGDIVVDADQKPPIVLEDARDYVDALLARVPPLVPGGTSQAVPRTRD